MRSSLALRPCGMGTYASLRDQLEAFQRRARRSEGSDRGSQGVTREIERSNTVSQGAGLGAHGHGERHRPSTHGAILISAALRVSCVPSPSNKHLAQEWD